MTDPGEDTLFPPIDIDIPPLGPYDPEVDE